MNATISKQKLDRYFSITKEALMQAGDALDEERRQEAEDFLDMAQRYYDDAKHFMEKKEDCVLAFAALNYAHGWLDAGARIRLFHVHDSRLFTVDEQTI